MGKYFWGMALLSLFMISNSSKLKDMLSHMYEFNVAQVESRHSTILNVSLFKGRYVLSTRNAVYSFADKYESFADAFRKTNIQKREINKVLVLGYGLGSIPQILSQHYSINCHYTAVEIDPAVINLTGKYGFMPEKSRIDLHCCDAFDFVKNDTEKYDLICVDLFIDDTVPECAESDIFLTSLKSMLKENGLLLYSRMNSDKFQQAATNAFRRDHFKKVFSPSSEVETSGNLVLVYDAG